jgi:glycosyltransferase involved in cell wall biosynthesis
MLSATPYGYHFAADACDLDYSVDHGEGRLASLLRRAMLKTLGFNLLHAWHNRRALFAADVVWTHTEHEHLAAALLLRLSRRRERPLLLAQSIWLADGWPKFPGWKRRLYRWLMIRADALTVHSELNRQVLQSLLPEQPVEQVYFGIETELLPRARVRTGGEIAGRPLRVLALGNDRHRDWRTLKLALGNVDGVEVRLITLALPAEFTAGVANFDLRPPRVPTDIPDAYAWADLLVVPLIHNLHASGITVVLEGVALGVPVLCSDAGGLSGYFSAEQIAYIPVANPEALRAAVIDSIRDYGACIERAHRATRRLHDAHFSAREFAQQHVTITERMLGARHTDVAIDGSIRAGKTVGLCRAVERMR